MTTATILLAGFLAQPIQGFSAADVGALMAMVNRPPIYPSACVAVQADGSIQLDFDRCTFNGVFRFYLGEHSATIEGIGKTRVEIGGVPFI